MGFAFEGGMGGMRGPVQVWTGSADEELTTPFHAAAVKAAWPAADYRVVPGAGHFAFIAPCTAALREIAPMVCMDPAGIDRVGFKVGFNREVVEFFLGALR